MLRLGRKGWLMTASVEMSCAPEGQYMKDGVWGVTDGRNASALTSDDFACLPAGASAAFTAFFDGATCTSAFMPAP